MQSHSDPHDRGERSSVLPQVLIGLVGVYVTGFALIVVDELVFHTFILVTHTPDHMHRIVEIAYWPLIQLIHMVP